MVNLDLYSLTDLRRPGALRALGAAFDEEPRLKPDRMDRRDPIREKIASVADYLGRIEDEPGAGFESYLFERRTRPRLGGGVSFERQAPERLEIPHRDYLSMEEDELLAAREFIEPLGDLFVRLPGVFDGFYGFATHTKLPWQQRVELVEAARPGEPVPPYPTAATDRTSVRDVYWINFFGPAYVERWAGRLDGLGVRSVATRLSIGCRSSRGTCRASTTTAGWSAGP
jgi:hypothetical protein